MTAENRCVVCGRPMADVAYACHADALSLAETLTVAAGHAEDAETVIARQARYGGGGSSSSDEPMPADLAKSQRLGVIAVTVTTWVNAAIEDGQLFNGWRAVSGPACKTGVRCLHSSCAATRVRTPPSALAWEFQWLSGQMSWLRHHPAADEAFTELRAACEDLARLVDRPADKDVVGMCDCGKVLYAPRGKALVTCPVLTCRLTWDVAQSREILRRSLDGKLVTVAEAARLAAYLDGDRTQDTIRKLIEARVKSGRLAAHGEYEAEPTFRFGEIVLLLATIPKRERKPKEVAA